MYLLIYDRQPTYARTNTHTHTHPTQAAKSKALSEAAEALKEEKRALEEAQHRLQTEYVGVSVFDLSYYIGMLSITRLND